MHMRILHQDSQDDGGEEHDGDDSGVDRGDDDDSKQGGQVMGKK